MISARDFALVPLAVVLGFVVLAALSIAADQSRLPGVSSARGTLSQFISPQAASVTLQVVASGLLTVTSITFSVLLLAVQQTASNLSPVVFDQFSRRKGNQALVGFFVGLALYAYTVLAFQSTTAPIVGAGVAIVLTAFAMLFLLLVIYTTINQMRPTNVLRQIHKRTVAARDREAHLLALTRRTERSVHDVVVTHHAETSGYVNQVRLGALAEIASTREDVEFVLHKAIGDYVAFGDAIASVRDGDPTVAEELAEAVDQAVTIGPERDLDHDPTTGIDQLGNIAWTSGSSSKQNPEVAREALDLIRDLAVRFLSEPLHEHEAVCLPVVYPEHDKARLREVLFSLLVVSHESQQHTTAARALAVYQDLIERTEGETRAALITDVTAAAELLDAMPDTPFLASARAQLSDCLAEVSRSTV